MTQPQTPWFYAVMTTILNPVIYSLRNAGAKAMLKRSIQKMGHSEI